jgi:hypothetical protein
MLKTSSSTACIRAMIRLLVLPVFLTMFFCCQKQLIITETGDEKMLECPDPVAGGDCAKGVAVTICSNHGHYIADRTLENIMIKGPQSYDIQGSGDHNHEIYINGGLYFRLQNNQGIQFISSTKNGHYHRVTINCAR